MDISGRIFRLHVFGGRTGGDSLLLRQFIRCRRFGAYERSGTVSTHQTTNPPILPRAGALALVTIWALLCAWWIPRGPTSTLESLVSFGIGLIIGLAAGRLMRSRWAIIVAPLAFMVVFELARLGTNGPTVDGIHLSTYGIIALITGRLFHGLVALAPMAWGAALGAAIFHSRAGTAPRRRIRRLAGATSLVVTGLLLAAFGVVLARPASTVPIRDAGGAPAPSSIAELTEVPIGGHDLGLMIRGHDTANPVLLFLAGGPGGSELGAMRRHLPALEEHFTVVTWDQRGTGRSYGALDPTETMTLDATIADTLDVTDYLRGRFGQDRIYLVGQSWGSTLGVLAITAAPEKYAAFIGVGQMVSQRETDVIFHEDTLAWAEASGQSDLAAELRQIGEPPYDDPINYETVLSHAMAVYPYDHSPNSEGQGQMSENIFVREYSLTEQVRLLAGMLDTFAVLYPQLQDIDFRESATRLEVPVFFVQGAHEARGRSEPFARWYPLIEAPVKDLVTLSTSGHRPMFEQPDEFVSYLTETVRPMAEAAAPDLGG